MIRLGVIFTLYIYVCMYVSIYLYIYIYIEDFFIIHDLGVLCLSYQVRVNVMHEASTPPAALLNFAAEEAGSNHEIAIFMKNLDTGS